MQYTLWSRGVLIGETDFALGSLNGPRMAGIFHPAVSGMMLLPTLTAMAPAILGLTGALKRVNLTPADAACDPDAVFAAIADSPEGQQMYASAKEIEQLELRAPGGRVIEYESILLSDLEDFAKLAERSTGTKKRRRKRRGDPIRYLLTVTLSGHEGDDVDDRLFTMAGWSAH